MKIFLSWIISAIAILIVAYLLPGVTVATFWTALILAVVIAIINAVLRPILLAITLPINFLTLGLSTFVVNALLIMLAAAIVPGFMVANFWWALLFSVIIGLVNGFFGMGDSGKVTRAM